MNCFIGLVVILMTVVVFIIHFTRKKEGYKSQDFLWDCCTDCNLDNQETSHVDGINADWEEDIDWTDGDINWWENIE